ncbi:SDR family NAD(P)-dependent oxidoreductase [Algoriphagus hitonicola]|uniref:NAD(P)-dependent dehydrogenase, short-chain alcohol dehydrogenase family n=1 Tax=Algoriphagus hitonicola TaxID=435880 RepID=A0A1I2TKP4_9BACT|nr:SDR family NAD(P)-dependent oxidoreductase [Algoriphagus hitonicola]SFG65482.1 NAD(P)-dependent dehydrogenase, short-chain alcohol dehydrogenase family [Algoriphagus hitonicola]
MEIKGKYAVITGGAGGIGLETAKLYFKEGAEGVAIVDFSQEGLQEAKSQLMGQNALFIQADVSKSEDVKRFIDESMEVFGRIDILFLNAGVEGVVKSMVDYPEDKFDQVIGVNVKGVWLGMKHGFPALKKGGGGSVIITSSVAGLRGTAQVSAYVASKHATIGLMRTGALEGAPDNIRVNSIHPSPVDNRMMRSLEEGFSPGSGDQVKEGFTKMIPLGRYAENGDIAEMALFLASDRSRFVTGATMVVDGGFTA